MYVSQVTCYDLTADGLTANANCPSGSKPPTQQSCIVAHCYAWQPGTWGSCSVSCGNGFQTRTNNWFVIVQDESICSLENVFSYSWMFSFCLFPARI